jgi:hypothetical protein
MPNRVVTIVNKWYECDPFLAALMNENGRPAGCRSRWLELKHPRRRTNSKTAGGQASTEPRAILPLRNGTLEVWCISDLREDLPDISSLQSSPKEKADRLPVVFRGSTPALVMAVGTAAMAIGRVQPATEPAAGHVLVGTSVFMHDFHPEQAGQPAHWDAGPYDTILGSSLRPALFDALLGSLTPPDAEVAKRFILPPLFPATRPHVLARYDLASVGSLNVTNVNEYAAADQRALDAHVVQGANPSLPRSLETTHGLIRVQSPAPFLFISGIANRALAAATELIPQKYAQETAAACNAGVVAAWLLPQLDSFIAGDDAP